MVRFCAIDGGVFPQNHTVSTVPLQRAAVQVKAMEPSRSPTLPHHKHQSSLEGIIDFSSEPPLALGIRDRARRRFYRIADHFDAEGGNNANGGYDRSRLIRLTYDYARSPASQDNFLRAFFRSLELPLDREDDNDLDHLDERVRAAFFGFADCLVDNFFLPSKSCTVSLFFFFFFFFFSSSFFALLVWR